MNNIKNLRLEKGLTQIKLAELFDIDQTTVSKWELGKALPDTSLLIRLADFFDVSIDYLLGLSTFYYPDSLKTQNDLTLTLEERQVLEDFRSLPRQERAQAAEYVHYLADRRGQPKKKA